MMRLATCSLIVLVLCAAFASAAPAPLAKPSTPLDSQEILAQLKQHMLREHNTYADHVKPTDLPTVWEVVGNTPVLTDTGRMIYEQNTYLVSVTAADRKGGARFEVTQTNYSRRRMVITR